MPIAQWECAHGDAPPVTLRAAATVVLQPDDDSVDTNNVLVAGSGSIHWWGSAPLITKRVTFNPTGTPQPITLIHNPPKMRLLGGQSKTIPHKSVGEYTCDGAGNWTELYFIDTTASADAGTGGPPGPPGPQGEPGPAGPKGNTGAAGPPGPTGPQGATGAGGAVGPPGPQGPQGATGNTGAAGTPGAPGGTGPQGPTGATGATGSAGPGVAAGGTTGQVLTKNSATNYDTIWSTPSAGGSTITVGATPPGSPSVGNLWWDNVGGQLYVWYNDGTSSQWVVTNNPPAAPSPPILRNFIDGFQSVPGTTSIAWGGGQCADSTNSLYISGGAITKTTAAFAAGNNNGGLAAGVTLAAATWYYVFAAIIAGAFDIFYDTDAGAANKPTGTTAFRRIWAFKTAAAATTIQPYSQNGSECLWTPAFQEKSSVTIPNSNTAFTVVSAPPAFPVMVQLRGSGAGVGGQYQYQLFGFDEGTQAVSGGNINGFAMSGAGTPWMGVLRTNAGQVRWCGAASSNISISLWCNGYSDFRGRDS